MVLNTAGLPAAKVQREPAKEIREQQAQGLSWAGGSDVHYMVGLCLKTKNQGWDGAQW